MKAKKAKKPAWWRRASSSKHLSWERRYANLGHLLPKANIEQAVEPGVSALPVG